MHKETEPWREASFKALIPFIVFVVFPRITPVVPKKTAEHITIATIKLTNKNLFIKQSLGEFR